MSPEPRNSTTGRLLFGMIVFFACGESDGDGVPDAGTLSAGQVCDLVESTVCEKARECSATPYPECEADWRDLCCQAAQRCNGVTSTSLADIEVCVTDIIAISCESLDMNGSPDSCDSLSVPEPDAGI